MAVLTAKHGTVGCTLSSRSLFPWIQPRSATGVTGIQRNEGNHLGITLNINRNPRHCPACSGQSRKKESCFPIYPCPPTRQDQKDQRRACPLRIEESNRWLE